MANTLNLGTDGNWATKEGSLLGYNSENNNYKPLPFEFDRASSATRVNEQGLIETVGANVPRIDYSSGEGSLKLEPSRTNLLQYSEDFSQWNIGGGGTGSAPIVTSNNAISPDGTQNADKIVFNKGAGVASSDLSVISSSSFTSQTNTASFYIKADTPQKIVFRNSTNWQLLDVTTEWQRISKTDTGGGVQIGLRDGYGISGIPDTATVYLWGAQAEEGSFSTSYIKTEGSAVTRLADSCNNGANEQVINSTEGVLYAEISSFKNGGIGDRTISLSDGSTQNAIQLLLHNTANRINFRSRSGGSLDVNISDFTFQQNQTNKIACKFKSGDYALWVNGEERVTSSSSSLPTGLSVLALNEGSLNDFYGNVKDVRVYSTTLTDQELRNLTKV